MQSNGARALVALAGIAVIVVAFFVISGSDDSDDGGSEATTAATTTDGNGGAGKAQREPAEPAADKLEVTGGETVGGTAELTYTKGDDVEIVISSDAASEFHLHGYDIEETASPGEPARFEFTADIEGKFELEDHHSLALIAELTVNP